MNANSSNQTATASAATTFNAGNVIQWRNGALCFRETLFQGRDGRLFVRSITSPIPLSTLLRNFNGQVEIVG